MRPSVSQLHRRIASDRFVDLHARMERLLRRPGTDGSLCLDGRALAVSPVSQDRDARRGHVPGGMAKGYKLHAVVQSDGKVADFSVLPLNCHEMPVARDLLARRHELSPGTLVLADGNYDAHVLHKQVDVQGGFLFVRLRGRARHPVTLKQMGPARRRLIDLWDRYPEAMQRVYEKRNHVERVFGRLAATPGLLGPLPAFVRGMTRVRRWVTAKLALYHALIDVKKNQLCTR